MRQFTCADRSQNLGSWLSGKSPYKTNLHNSEIQYAVQKDVFKVNQTPARWIGYEEHSAD